MARYNLKAFLTLVPERVLRQYFQRDNLLGDFPWDTEFNIDNLHAEILAKTDHIRIEHDFRTINKCANEVGIANLIEEARSSVCGGLELGEELGGMENDHERAMYVWVKHPKIFRWAMELTEWENRAGKIHRYVGAGLVCDGEKACEALGGAMAEYFKKQSKGSRCRVNYCLRPNPVRHFFFAYPEDGVKGYRAYNDGDEIVRKGFQPLFEVVFEYNAEHGDVAIHARGKKVNDKMFELFCIKALGFEEPPNPEAEVFDLACLKNPEFRFSEDPAIPVESAALKMVKVNLNKGSNRRITLEASPVNGDDREVESMLASDLIAHRVSPEDVTVQKAKIEIQFKPVNLQKIGKITFTVGLPQYSTLSDDDKSEMAKEYLRKWGILKKHQLRSDATDAA